MTTYDRKPTSIEQWPSLSACVEAAIQRPGWGCDDERQFNGGTFAEAKEYALHGWTEGAREATERSRRVVDRLVNSTTAMHLTTELSYDVAGACYDAGAYYSGAPECWIRPEPQLTRRAISIAVNICASYGVDARTLRTRGMAVASLVLALQAKGYPVTVDVAQVATYESGYGETYCKSVRVIDASTGSQLDIDRLVYAIAHPTMFRCVFRAITGYGWGGSRPESDGYPPGEYDLRFGGAHLKQAERWVDGGEAWIMEEFNKQTAVG